MNTAKQTINTLTHFADQFELMALSPGPINSNPAANIIDDNSWQSLIRARRLRVLDWLSQSGFSLLNIIPAVTESFLQYASHSGLVDKYATAAKFWSVLKQQLSDPQGWFDQIAQLEIGLILARQQRPIPPPLALAQPISLASGVTILYTSTNALAFHTELPSYHLPAKIAADHCQALLAKTAQMSLTPQPVMAIGALPDGSGMLIELTPQFAQLLDGLSTEPISCERLKKLISIDDWQALIDLQVLTNGGCA